MERTIFGEGDGSGLKTFDLDIGKVGGLCCWEHLQPLSKYAMYSFGEQVHAASWPSFSRRGPYAFGPEVSSAASQIYAVEGQCFVLMAVAVRDERVKEVLADFYDKTESFKRGGGFANIFGPDGKSMVTPLPETEEGLLIAELDLSNIVMAKAFADPAGHYARPDVTRLLLNNNPAPRVQRMETPMVTVEAGKSDEEQEERTVS